MSHGANVRVGSKADIGLASASGWKADIRNSYYAPMDQGELLALAGIQPVVGRGRCLLNCDQVTRLLPFLRERDIVVLGIEGFHVTPDHIQPRMDQIADFSSVMNLPPHERSDRSVHEARDFLATAANTALFFELALRPAS